MALESVDHIDDLNAANPLGTDARSYGDDHIRNIKKALKADFPNIDAAVTTTPAELNVLDGVTGGTVLASSAVVVDASKKVNEWLVDNLTIDGNSITAGTGVVNIVPASGSAIVLDGTVNVDAGVITGATSITSTAFVGTLSTAAQANITSVGILTTLSVDNITINGNTVSSTDVAGDITVTPHTTGDIVLDGVKWPQADGSAGQYLKTDGSAQTSWVTGSPAADVLTTHGDLVFQNSTPANARLSAGTAGQWLQTEGSSADPVWSNTFKAAVVGGDQTLSAINLKDYAEVTNAIGSTGGGTQAIDLTLGNSVSATVDTSANTFTFTNPTASDELCGFTLTLVNGGSQTVNWPGTVDWAGGTAPTLIASGTDILCFFTINGGSLWHGFLASGDSK